MGWGIGFFLVFAACERPFGFHDAVPLCTGWGIGLKKTSPTQKSCAGLVFAVRSPCIMTDSRQSYPRRRVPGRRGRVRRSAWRPEPPRRKRHRLPPLGGQGGHKPPQILFSRLAPYFPRYLLVDLPPCSGLLSRLEAR